MRSRLLTTAAVAALAALSLSACGDDPSPVAADPSPTQHSAPSDPPAADAPVIPDDFPILDGYPADRDSEGGENGRHGPSRDLEPLRFEACGTTLPLPEVTDRLRGGWTNPEDYRERQLSVFASDEEAADFVAAIEDLYAACGREDTDDGYTSVNDLVDGTLGDESVTHVRHYELDGAPAIGLATTTVVRVGSWVLVSSTYDEGSADTPQDVAAVATHVQGAVEDLVAAMQSPA
jgi:hypothetical protein